MKLLVVEDEPSLQELMVKALLKEGYVVETASTFAEADSKIAGYTYDCILLDVMLPGGSGLELLEHLRREHKNVNVIIISARNSIDDKVRGLDLGADDYLPKPFHLAELLARVKSVLRRGKSGGEFSIELGNVILTPQSKRVLVDGKELKLVKKEFDILLYFMQRPGYVIDKSTLAEAVWGDYADESDNFQFLYAQIKNLRKKLAESGAIIEISAVYGFGYKMIV